MSRNRLTQERRQVAVSGAPVRSLDLLRQIEIYCILLNILFSNNLSLRFSVNVSDKFSHPYKKTQNYSSVYINLYIFRYGPCIRKELHSSRIA